MRWIWEPRFQLLTCPDLGVEAHRPRLKVEAFGGRLRMFEVCNDDQPVFGVLPIYGNGTRCFPKILIDGEGNDVYPGDRIGMVYKIRFYDGKEYVVVVREKHEPGAKKWWVDRHTVLNSDLVSPYDFTYSDLDGPHYSTAYYKSDKTTHNCFTETRMEPTSSGKTKKKTVYTLDSSFGNRQGPFSSVVAMDGGCVAARIPGKKWILFKYPDTNPIIPPMPEEKFIFALKMLNMSPDAIIFRFG